MSSCQYPNCEDAANVKVSYDEPEAPKELCKVHFEIEDKDIPGKYYQIGARKTEILVSEETIS